MTEINFKDGIRITAAEDEPVIVILRKKCFIVDEEGELSLCDDESFFYEKAQSYIAGGKEAGSKAKKGTEDKIANAPKNKFVDMKKQFFTIEEDI